MIQMLDIKQAEKSEMFQSSENPHVHSIHLANDQRCQLGESCIIHLRVCDHESVYRTIIEIGKTSLRADHAMLHMHLDGLVPGAIHQRPLQHSIVIIVCHIAFKSKATCIKPRKDMVYNNVVADARDEALHDNKRLYSNGRKRVSFHLVFWLVDTTFSLVAHDAEVLTQTSRHFRDEVVIHHPKKE